MRKLLFAPSIRSISSPMDNEQINQIGNKLADLSARTDALRGYL
jgi:hypothetical protein